MVFISLSNINPGFKDNVISIGISLESQIAALIKFLKNKKKNKTIILLPKNQYTKLVEEKIENLGLENFKTFKYNPDPKILTGEIEKLTNYAQRKKKFRT